MCVFVLASSIAGARLSAVIWLLAGLRLDVRQNVSGAPHFHVDRRRRRVQGQNVARHAAHLAGVRTVAARRTGGDTVGGGRPNGTPSQQSDARDQSDRPQRGLPASGEI